MSIIDNIEKEPYSLELDFLGFNLNAR